MDVGPLRDGLTVIAGAATGAMSAAFGIGGAALSTPAIRALGASPFIAVGSTLPAILPSAATGTLSFARGHLVDWRIVRAIAPSGVITAVIGALLAKHIPGHGHILMLITAVVLGLSAVRLASRNQPHYDVVVAPAGPTLTAIGAFAGLLSGLLGIGGGTVLVPSLGHVGVPIRTATATSLVCVGILAIPSTVTHAVLGNIDWRIALVLVAGVIPGAHYGSTLAMRARDHHLRLSLAAFNMTVAVVYGVGELIALVR